MIDPTWILALMLKVEPSSPFRATFDKTAAAIARASDASPLFGGDHGGERTAALVVSVAWFEGRLNPRAEGDRTCKRYDGERCIERGEPTSFCTMQIAESNFPALGVTREIVQGSIDSCIDAGLRMMKSSFSVCRAKPLEHRLDWYATGGEGCVAPFHDEGVHRVRRGQWLFGAVPLPES
jgi:hypothetical protein